MAKKLSTIIIKPESIGELTEAVMSIREGSKSDTWASSAAILASARAAEGRLEQAGVPLKARVDCGYEFTDAGPSAAAYRFKKSVPTFTLIRRPSGWSVVRYGQADVYPKAKAVDRVVLTKAARDAVVASALKPFHVAA